MCPWQNNSTEAESCLRADLYTAIISLMSLCNLCGCVNTLPLYVKAKNKASTDSLRMYIISFTEPLLLILHCPHSHVCIVVNKDVIAFEMFPLGIWSIIFIGFPCGITQAVQSSSFRVLVHIARKATLEGFRVCVCEYMCVWCVCKGVSCPGPKVRGVTQLGLHYMVCNKWRGLSAAFVMGPAKAVSSHAHHQLQ